MGRLILIPSLIIAVFLGACSDVTGIGGGRSVEGHWSGTVDREDIFLTLTEDRGRIFGSGSWGPDALTVEGNRSGSDVSLVLEFSTYEPVNLQGSVSRDRIDGWVTGSGYRDLPAVLWRD